MQVVQPIRDLKKIEEMKDELKKNGTRDYMMFHTGVNSRHANIRYCKAECR